MDFERVVTHNDFDGVVSAALCSCVFGCERFVFTGPNSVNRSEISIGTGDIVCDLPYPLECGLWFDHHPGNSEAVRLRGLDPAGIPGRFSEEPSCARVVYDYFIAAGKTLPAYFAGTVTEADTIDAFNYRCVEEWRRETPGKLVDMSLKAYFPTHREQTKYLNRLTVLIRDAGLEDVLGDGEVASNLRRFREEERRMIDFIAKSIGFLREDVDRELVLLDFTHHNRRPRIIKNLAYLVHTDALGVLTLNPMFQGGRKTNSFSVSMSLSMNMTGRDHGKDIGEIMRSLNIGDGHVGAAAGTVHCETKDEMLRVKKRVLAEIWRLWKSMPAGGAHRDTPREGRTGTPRGDGREMPHSDAPR